MGDTKLTLEEAKDMVKTKENLYKAMIRNRWYLPSFKSSIVTQDYMKGVREKVYFCPTYEQLKLQPCPDPPPKELLLDEVVKITADKGLDIGASDNRVPDKAWLITMLGYLDPEHEFFKKDYLPPVRKPLQEEMVVDNSDGFYSGLPSLYKKKDLKARSKLKEYQSCRYEQKIKTFKMKKAKMEKSIQMENDKMKEFNKKKEMIRVSKDHIEDLEKKMRHLKEQLSRKKGKEVKTPNKNELTLII